MADPPIVAAPSSLMQSNVRNPGSPSPSATEEDHHAFLNDLLMINTGRNDRWLHTNMPWNTIHRMSWFRCESLGQGAYGSVHVGMRTDMKLFAVKSVNVELPFPDHRATAQFGAQLTEIVIMRTLRSKYIVRSLGCGRSNGANGLNGRESFDIFLEYAVRGSLRHVMDTRNRPFEEVPYIRQYTHDILRALQYMQQQGVVHGDIKMDNLLLTDDCVKLADWGGAKRLNSENLRMFLIGTQGFLSPEVASRIEQGCPSDIYSLGCTIIEMATGNSPHEIMTWVSTGMPIHVRRAEIPTTLSLEARDFLKHCLCRRPADRWTAAELLHHPFISQRDVNNQLAYAQPVPRSISHSVLVPPHINYTEPANEPVTSRVYRHLTGRNTPLLWRLGLVRSTYRTLPEALQRSGSLDMNQFAVPPPAAPLPPFIPDLVLEPNTRLGSLAAVMALINQGAPNSPDHGHDAATPRVAQNLPGPGYGGSDPATPRVAQNLLGAGYGGGDFESLFVDQNLPSAAAGGHDPPTSPRVVQNLPSLDTGHRQASPRPPSSNPTSAETQRWLEGLMAHAEQMCELNNQLLEEAQKAASEGATDQLFGGAFPSSPRRPAPFRSLIAGCTGEAAVDAVQTPKRRRGND